MDYVRSLAITLAIFAVFWIAFELVQRLIAGVLS